MAAIHLTDRADAARAGLPFGDVGRSLAQAALCALEAPSVLATRPWRWRIDNSWAALDTEHSRRGPGADADDRLTAISCGAALHHAMVALAADGIGVEVVRFPWPQARECVAVLRHTGPVAVDARAQRLRRAIALRGSDRRIVGGEVVAEAQLRLLADAAAAAGATLYPLPGRESVIVAAGAGPRDWLATGEAISAVLLNAAAEGLATGPVTARSADVAPLLARVLPAGAGRAAAVVHFGIAERS
ncbi:hypothetical protein [Dactylosporangium matsuzakiense]|uniref:Uncharacterized protein n=1 Tax=Dactylosporangium matsuzakiense TaxID=53360 RepID=A0A9W6KJW0_9ACTN|nr:hypothetical protein [Dactylosporangium matsuzakiense]UWZ48240.1 hypothetical protein Dmats_18630 [Dactylosporangium matsuzakiense]GLL01475.1 hypothetical protein GCM10017581_032160 [Dactylosporangium matsuzakiense]